MKCIQCGKEFKPTNKTNQLCSEECKMKRRKVTQREWRAHKRAQIGIRYKVNTPSTICTRAATCIYGAVLGTGVCCDYIGATGKSRGGYPGECKYYKKRKKKLRGGADEGED